MTDLKAEPIIEEPDESVRSTASRQVTIEESSDHRTKAQMLQEFQDLEEDKTVVTESLRSGSITDIEGKLIESVKFAVRRCP